MFLRADGAPPPTKNGSNPVVLSRYASARYFETMGIRLVRGRFFTDAEGGPTGPHPVVINEQLAKQLWPNVADPVGKRMIWNGDTVSTDWMTVVGVVRDVRHYGLVRPMIGGLYRSAFEADTTRPLESLGIAVRSATGEAAVVAAARAIVRDLDPELPLIDVRSAQSALNRSFAWPSAPSARRSSGSSCDRACAWWRSGWCWVFRRRCWRCASYRACSWV
jgi:hypothetical protein